MGYIFYVMGKSAAGKDTIYKELVRRFPEYGTVRMYTTRPIRDGEQEGVEYYFTDEARLKKLESQGKVIECRTYDTVFGPWSYFTADDGQIDLKQGNYLMIGTLDSYEKMVNYYGNEVISMWMMGRAFRGHWIGKKRRIRLNMRRCAGDFWQMRRTFQKNAWQRAGLTEGMKTMISIPVFSLF